MDFCAAVSSSSDEYNRFTIKNDYSGYSGGYEKEKEKEMKIRQIDPDESIAAVSESAVVVNTKYDFFC